ncbi:hypothetical protein MKZ01_10720 [Lysinibacillus endophyticus]|uniref:hypothetical protein n=2 Tax=Ureibacillus endophyticus TaxID=1978490 RepID=UPI003135C3C1
MEGIIMMVVLFIISSLFSGNKKSKEQKGMPPFNNKKEPVFDQKQHQPKKARTLEDFASEIFQQLNEKANPTVQPEPEVKIEKPVVIEKKENTRPKFDVNRSTKQISKGKEAKLQDPIKSKEIGSIIPKDRESLVQAIITSEILGPPKAKQR